MPTLEPATINFILSLAGWAFGILILILGWFLKDKVSQLEKSLDIEIARVEKTCATSVARLEECTKHLEQAQRDDTRDLTEWKLVYTKGHAEVIGQQEKLAGLLQGTIEGTLKSLSDDIRQIVVSLPELKTRLQALERLFDRQFSSYAQK